MHAGRGRWPSRPVHLAQAGRAPKKKNAHTAMSDIRESIKQLQYYRKHIFKQASGLV